MKATQKAQQLLHLLYPMPSTYGVQMPHSDQGLADSFYHQAMFNYVEACDYTCELYVEGKKPDVAVAVMAGTRFKSAYEKLNAVIKIANHKFGTNYTMPHLVLDMKYWEKVQ